MSDSMEPFAIDVRGISKCYQVYERPSDRLKQALIPRMKRVIGGQYSNYFREFWALRDVSFSVRPGETVGIIGRNGAGKSTLLQLICGTLTPTTGEVSTNGRIAALLELGSGFNPEFTGRENVYMNAAVLGLSETEIEERYDQIVAFSEIGDFIDQPVKTYSSGMYMRLAFAVQAHIDASIVIIDEALTVGDVFFRQKCYARLEQLRAAGAAIILVSHSMPDIEQYCERAVLIDHGKVRFIGPAPEAAKHYYLLNQPATSTEPESEVASEVAPASLSGLAGGDVLPMAALIDISSKNQVTNGQARCTGVALCDISGQPRSSFRQGERAVFFYEFELNADIEAPVCGLIIRNDRGIIVHGKNSLQFSGEVPVNLSKGTRVLCRHEIQLGLGIGDYVFEVGLVSITTSAWRNRHHISHEEMSSHQTRICHLSDVGSFSVGLALKDRITVLTHHGVADLHGDLQVTAVQ